ncbi:MAG: FtsX-like permease family protein [Candidatus Delongbacteria bacterium]|jgi:ABC-type lipoprotein release transport system permease subunit|nr:FtsX-like permease family protein [Candidatus Delongbacteria bacterium]
MNYTKLAWRNIWRNRRRTLITISSVFFALLLAILMRGLQLGTYDQMIKNSVEQYTGYVQIHQKGYQDDQVLNNAFMPNDSLKEAVLKHENVKALLPRLRTYSLASAKKQTKGVVIIGLDADKDDKLTKVKDKLVKGRMPKSGEQSVVLAEELANYLKLTIGDTAVFIGQGYHGISAAGLYPVVGIISYPVPQLNNTLAYMDIKTAQQYLSIGKGLTAWIVMLEDQDEYKETTKELRNIMPADYEVMHWETMQPGVKQGIEADNKSGLIILMILYIVIGFGIFGTVLMMIAERRNEFSIMVAVGMQKSRLAKLVTTETLMIVALGILSAMIVSIPFIWYLHLNPLTFSGELAHMFAEYGMEPIMPVAFEPGYFLGQTGVVLILTLIAVAWPLLSIFKLNVTKSIR